MILNHEEIKDKKIIEKYDEKNFSDGSYNLTISHIIDMKNKVSEEFTLKPQGMVYVVFKEKIKVPENVIGFAHVKTSLTRKGIMATNIGIIDTNYEGYISTLLINFGKTDNFFANGQSALRITFASMQKPIKKKEVSRNKIGEEDYIKELKQNIANLDEKFLNLNSVSNDVIKNVSQKILAFGVLFAIGSFLLSAFF